MEVRNTKFTEDEFLRERKEEVLTQWPTGKDIEDINEGVDYCKSLPWYKNYWRREEEMRKQGKIVLSAFLGDSTFEQMLNHLRQVEEYAPDNWDVLFDPYTRGNKYEEAQRAIDRSYKEGRPTLSGYPIVNFGVKCVRQLTEAAVSSFHSDCDDHDPRLGAEIAMAGGWNALLGNGFHEVMMHGKDYPLDKRIHNDQYTARLAAYYTEHGVPSSVRVLGNFPGWDTPGTKVTWVVLESLICAEQGVKRMNLLLSATMNLIQDCASLQVVKRVAADYLARSGYDNIPLSTTSISCQGVWPRDLDRAAAMAAWAAAIGTLGGADSIYVRAIDEAFNVATPERHTAAFKIAKQIGLLLGHSRLPESDEYRIEKQMIEAETRASVDKVLEIGDGDVVAGVIKGFDLGILDVCFSPYRYLKRKVLVIRDKDRGWRYLDHGNIPLPKAVIDYHQAKIAERGKLEGLKMDMDTVIKDVIYHSQALEPNIGVVAK